MDPETTRRAVVGLLARSDAVAARLATVTRQAVGGGRRKPDPAAALHFLLTRNRFLKGSRRLFSRTEALIAVRRFTDGSSPVRMVIRGFPFKQCDNGLKALGRLPDLAELGALVRLRELQRAYRELYPPGLHITVLRDGGYYRPRSAADIACYHDELVSLTTLSGVSDFIDVCAQADALAAAVGAAGWRFRNQRVEQLVAHLTAVLEPERAGHHAARATDKLSRLGLLLPGVPPFDALFRSLLYSVPVLGDGSLGWAAKVLDGIWNVHVAEPLRSARLAVRERAWCDAVRSFATATVDEQLDVLSSLSPHIRIATGAPRSHAFGLTYLGGSTLLPWHGTGFVDSRGRVGADFLISLYSRGYQPVYSSLLTRGQPWCMIPAVACDRQRSVADCLLSMRLKDR